VDMLEELYFENCDGMDAFSVDAATTEVQHLICVIP
jgi:hypothetical protein